MSSLKGYDKEFLHGLLREMQLIRRFEEKAGQMYGLKKIGGFCHLYNGQEAVAVGSIRALDLRRDHVITSYRDHAHALVCGMKPRVAMAELYGKITGCSRGKGGSMHLFDVENHMMGGHGIVGGQIPVGTGIAFKSAFDYKMGRTKDMAVTLCYFGDGAVNQGSFHESLNLAAIWKIPVIYVIENNMYAMGTALNRASSVENLADKAKAYGIEGRVVDGMDVLAVYEAFKDAVTQTRKTGNALLIEVKSYRYRGHSMSDPAKYRTKEELEQYKNLDPILQLKARMIEAGYTNDHDFRIMDEEIKGIVQEAVEFAEESPEPPLHVMYEDVYAE